MKEICNILRLCLLVVGICCVWTIAHAADHPEVGVKVWPHQCLFNGYLSGMSDNGRWGLAKAPDYCEEDAVARRYDLQTGEMVELPLPAAQSVAGSICKCFDISDDGMIIAGSYNDLPAYYTDGEWHQLPMPKTFRGYTGAVYSMTPDGEWMCGWVAVSFTKFRPVLWHNGEFVELKNLPTYDEMYERGIISKGVYNEHKEAGQSPNLAFFKISADGKTILSGVDHNYPGWGCSYILYDVPSDTYRWICDPEAGIRYVEYATMSNNGKWVGCTTSSVKYAPDGSWDDEYHSWMFDIETGKMTPGGGSGIIDDDGIVYFNSIPVDGYGVPIQKLLKGAYGIDFERETGYDTTGKGFFFGISSDGKTLMGQCDPRETGWSVTLSEKFVDVAKRINLLDTVYATPASGSMFSRFDRIELTLPENVEIDETKKLQLLDSEGNFIASNISTQRVTGRSFKFIFRPRTFEEGQKYYVEVPEGMFTIGEGKHRSPLTRVEYTGRSNTPVKPIAYMPEEGAEIMELSNYSMIMMEFDSELKVAENAYALLYEEGNEQPWCSMYVGVSGRNAGFYPPAARRLIKGRNYEFVLPAGMLTDITGNCANEEIRVTYAGSFLPTAPVYDGNLLFFDDFNDPNASLYNFLQYEGDHHYPTYEMQNWGFDADNTPWNFSVRDDEEYDYCAASTSMTDDGGAADDWLVLPQLGLAGPDNWLTFKSQSFRNGFEDRLRVYVWECDDRFGSLDATVMERVKRERILVYDELQTPGSNENVLAGDWQMNEVDLSQFAGKNVYICFVNENEDGSCLFVDDIKVEYRGNFVIVNKTEEVNVASEGIPVSVSLMVQGETTYSVIKVVAEATDGYRSEYMDNNVKLAKGDILDITLPEPYKLAKGKESELTVTVSLDDETQAIRFAVKNFAMQMQRRVLVEEGTGTWCGFCPLGIIATEYLEENYNDKVSIIAVHNDDKMAYAAYDGFMGLGGYPAGRVDRSSEVLHPVWYNDAVNSYSLTTPEGYGTFVDYVDKRLEIAPEGEVLLDNVEMKAGFYEVSGHVRFALDRNSKPMNLLLVVTEDGLAGYQNNDLTGNPDPLCGSWGQSDDRVLTEYKHVARGIAGTSFYGESGMIPQDVRAGETYSFSRRFAVPATVADAGATSIVAVMLDATDGSVINTAKAAVGYSSGLAEADSDAERTEIWTPAGIRVTDRALQRGIYIIRKGGKSYKVKI